MDVPYTPHIIFETPKMDIGQQQKSPIWYSLIPPISIKKPEATLSFCLKNLVPFASAVQIVKLF